MRTCLKRFEHWLQDWWTGINFLMRTELTISETEMNPKELVRPSFLRARIPDLYSLLFWGHPWYTTDLIGTHQPGTQREHIRQSSFYEKQFCPFSHESCMVDCCIYSFLEATSAAVCVFCIATYVHWYGSNSHIIRCTRIWMFHFC